MRCADPRPSLRPTRLAAEVLKPPRGVPVHRRYRELDEFDALEIVEQLCDLSTACRDGGTPRQVRARTYHTEGPADRRSVTRRRKPDLLVVPRTIVERRVRERRVAAEQVEREPRGLRSRALHHARRRIDAADVRVTGGLELTAETAVSASVVQNVRRRIDQCAHARQIERMRERLGLRDGVPILQLAHDSDRRFHQMPERPDAQSVTPCGSVCRASCHRPSSNEKGRRSFDHRPQSAIRDPRSAIRSVRPPPSSFSPWRGRSP